MAAKTAVFNSGTLFARASREMTPADWGGSRVGGGGGAGKGREGGKGRGLRKRERRKGIGGGMKVGGRGKKRVGEENDGKEKNKQWRRESKR